MSDARHENGEEIAQRKTQKRNTRNRWFAGASKAFGISTSLSYSAAGIAELATENSMLASYLLQALPYFGIAHAALNIVRTCIIGESIYYDSNKGWSKGILAIAYLDILLTLGSGSQLMYFSIKALGLPLASAGFGLLFNGFAIKAAANLLITGAWLHELSLQRAAEKNKDDRDADRLIRALEERIANCKAELVNCTLALAAWGLLALGHPAGLAFLAGTLLMLAVNKYTDNRFFKPSPSASVSGSPGQDVQNPNETRRVLT